MAETEPNLEQMVPQLKLQDPAAFEQLVRSLGGKMLATALRILRSEDDAKDAVQDAFLSAYRALPTFDGQSLISTWIHRICVNAALQKLRKRKRQREQPIENLLPGFKSDGHQDHRSPKWREITESELERQETRQIVRDSIEELPEIYRNVMLLRDIEDMSTEETAKVLGITDGTVKTRLHRARLALRGLLEPHFRKDAV